jgi:hypothetical protein
MIFTYLIKYEGIDNLGSIEFCAENKIEAVSLFDQWCVDDNKMPAPVLFKCIEIIYNYDDALEYGSRYGNPV